MVFRRILLSVALIGVLIAASACHQSAGGGGAQGTPAAEITVQFAYEPDPAQVGESVLLISLRDPNDAPINNATVNVRGDMNHAGMQPVLAQLSAGQGGVYRIPFEWTMAGDWFVVVDVTLADGSTLSQRFDLRVES